MKEDDYLNITSGSNTLFVDGAIIANGKMIVPKGSFKSIGVIGERGPAGKYKSKIQSGIGRGNDKKNRNLAPSVDHRSVLAVRVKALDSTTTADLTTISDEVFGTLGDTCNLRERYDTCSYGAVLMDPFNGNATTGEPISNGVYQVNITVNVTGRTASDVQSNVTSALQVLLGNLPTQFDHVMVCLPPGTAPGWISYSKLHTTTHRSKLNENEVMLS